PQVGYFRKFDWKGGIEGMEEMEEPSASYRPSIAQSLLSLSCREGRVKEMEETSARYRSSIAQSLLSLGLKVKKQIAYLIQNRMKNLLINSLGLFMTLVVLAGGAHAQGTQLNIATFNIRYANPNDAPDTWDKRHPVIANMIRFHEMDIVGIQEGLDHQVYDLSEGLRNYDYVGVGRDDGKEKGEFSEIGRATCRER